MPNLSGLDLTSAESVLNTAGISFLTHHLGSTTVADGMVISQDPLPGTSVNVGLRSATIRVSSGMPNTTPILDQIGDQVAFVDQVLEFTVTSSDLDGDSLSWNVFLSTATGASLTIIGASFVDHEDGTGTFSWTPTVSQVGSNHQVIFIVKDTGVYEVYQEIINFEWFGQYGKPGGLDVSSLTEFTPAEL